MVSSRPAWLTQDDNSGSRAQEVSPIGIWILFIRKLNILLIVITQEDPETPLFVAATIAGQELLRHLHSFFLI